MVSKDCSDRRFRVKELLKYKIKSDKVFSPLNIYPKYAGLSLCEIRSLFYISPFFTNKDRLWPLCICNKKKHLKLSEPRNIKNGNFLNWSHCDAV